MITYSSSKLNVWSTPIYVVFLNVVKFCQIIVIHPSITRALPELVFFINNFQMKLETTACWKYKLYSHIKNWYTSLVMIWYSFCLIQLYALAVLIDTQWHFQNSKSVWLRTTTTGECRQVQLSAYSIYCMCSASIDMMHNDCTRKKYFFFHEILKRL